MIIPVPIDIVCPAPNKIVLTELDNSFYIADEKNVKTLMINIADLMAYINRLKNTIECYKGVNADGNFINNNN